MIFVEATPQVEYFGVSKYSISLIFRVKSLKTLSESEYDTYSIFLFTTGVYLVESVHLAVFSPVVISIPQPTRRRFIIYISYIIFFFFLHPGYIW